MVNIKNLTNNFDLDPIISLTPPSIPSSPASFCDICHYYSCKIKVCTNHMG
uniref:Uncharacterized protein n=1 Tax=Anguilla anguilla TaxID=7936 RepID=A0A0E9TV85_ANGAN